MAVDTANLNYVPTLAIRQSEMNGLERLPGATKDRIQPTFLLAPWVGSSELMKAIDRIRKAFPHRPFFLDIDQDYLPAHEPTPAQAQWLELRDPANNFSNWLGFVSAVPDASPCIQFADQSAFQIAAQVTAYQEMEKSFALRIELSRMPENIDDVIAGINSVGSADYAVIIEAGWLSNSQPAQFAVVNLIRNTFSSIDAQVPIVVSYTSMPKGYEKIQGSKQIDFDNRQVLNQIRQLTNRQRLTYGDWGSTRPREAGIKRKGPPRIDIALRDSWVCTRNPAEAWGFAEAAEAIIDSDYWAEIEGLNVWGEFMIRQTKTDPEIGINSAQKNIAARVNLHLHTQAFYDRHDLIGMNLDEPWED